MMSTEVSMVVYLLATLASFVGLRFYWGMAKAVILPAVPPHPAPARLGDAIFSGILAAWFLMVVAQSGGAGGAVVTRAAIVGSAVIYGGMAGLIVTFVAVRGLSLADFFGARWTAWRQGVRETGLALAAILPIVIAAQWAGSGFVPEGGETQPLVDFWINAPGVVDRVLVVVMAVVVAPLCEEVIFRGYLLNAARRFVGPVWAIVVTSLLFAAIHVHLPAFLGLFALSVALGLFYLRQGSIWAPVLLHAAFNGVTLVTSLLWPELA